MFCQSLSLYNTFHLRKSKRVEFLIFVRLFEKYCRGMFNGPFQNCMEGLSRGLYRTTAYNNSSSSRLKMLRSHSAGRTSCKSEIAHSSCCRPARTPKLGFRSNTAWREGFSWLWIRENRLLNNFFIIIIGSSLHWKIQPPIPPTLYNSNVEFWGV